MRLIAALPTHAWLPATPTCHCPSALLPHVACHMASTTLHTNELHHRQTAATNMPPPGIDALARDGRTTMTKRRDHRLKDGLPSEPQAPNAGAIDYYIHSGYVPARSLHRRIAQQSSLEKEARPRMATDVPSRTLGSKKFTRPFHLLATVRIIFARRHYDRRPYREQEWLSRNRDPTPQWLDELILNAGSLW